MHLFYLFYRTINNNLFRITNISEIISSPSYVGKVCFNKLVAGVIKEENENYILVDGLHEAI
ncbi:MAG: hypothetical protein K0S61_556 [Anaerocolumna sp.]|jgi:site-specific DNA recombinase|nr:hypothetical protein [Anaerocolumna sp.]